MLPSTINRNILLHKKNTSIIAAKFKPFENLKFKSHKVSDVLCMHVPQQR